MNRPQIITDNEQKVKDALEVWADWMRGSGIDLGYGSPMGFESGGSAISSWEDFEHRVDKNMAINVQAIYEGLPPYQQMAIDHFHLSAVYTFRRRNILEDYGNALIAMEVGLRGRLLI